MGRWYDAVLNKYMRDSDESLDESYYSYLTTADGMGGIRGPPRQLTNIFSTSDGSFTLPTAGTSLPAFSDGISYFPTADLIPTPTGGYAPVVPHASNLPDANGVALTLLPAYALKTATTGTMYSGYVGTDGASPFSDLFPVKVCSTTPSATTTSFHMLVPMSVPAATGVVVFWLYNHFGNTLTSVSLSGGTFINVTTTSHGSTGKLNRYAFNYTPSGGAGFDGDFDLAVTFTHVNEIYASAVYRTQMLVAVQVPLNVKKAFKFTSARTLSLTIGAPPSTSYLPLYYPTAYNTLSAAYSTTGQFGITTGMAINSEANGNGGYRATIPTIIGDTGTYTSGNSSVSYCSGVYEQSLTVGADIPTSTYQGYLNVDATTTYMDGVSTTIVRA